MYEQLRCFTDHDKQQQYQQHNKHGNKKFNITAEYTHLKESARPNVRIIHIPKKTRNEINEMKNAFI